jgi:hypothetical protein
MTAGAERTAGHEGSRSLRAGNDSGDSRLEKVGQDRLELSANGLRVLGDSNHPSEKADTEGMHVPRVYQTPRLVRLPPAIGRAVFEAGNVDRCV